MTPEETKELRELIALLKENEISEFDLERGDFKVRIKFASAAPPPAPAIDLTRIGQLLAPGQQPASAGPQGIHAVASAGSASAQSEEEPALHIVKSPIVGTFYESSSPGSPAFVKIGDEIENGQVLCIVEAMKLMNEIESDAAGEIVKRLVTNGQPVEYGQPLFALRVH
jgi:acetyl-CoA carboxylase biotin carboxyl carrier protein